MAKRYRGRTSRTTGFGRALENTAVGLARWAATDHFGWAQRIASMPRMGFFDTVRHIIVLFLIQMYALAVTSLLIFLFFAYVIPFLITGAFT